MASNDPILHTDVAVIGAGPVGLYQAFQLGLLGLDCHLIDALPMVGGQAAALYPDKPIYDIPGTPVCSGQELAQSLLRQLAPFHTPTHLGHTVTELERSDGGLLLRSQAGLQLQAKAVVIAAGAGAFEPRKLNIPSLQALEGRQVFYRDTDLPALEGRRLLVCGGEDAAVEAAVAAAERAAHVTLLHRRDALKAAPSVLRAWQTLLERGL